MTSPDIRAKLFRPMDAAVANDVKMLKYNEKYVPIVLATPSRATAKLQEALKIKNQAAIPLPYISVQRTNASFDQTRFIGPAIRRLQYSSNGRAVKNILWPDPYTFDYAITFWDRYKNRLSAVLEDYIMRFRPMHVIEVDYGEPYGSMRCHVAMQGIDDASNLEPGEDEDRLLRMSVTITVEGYLVRDLVSVPAVPNRLGVTEDSSLIDGTGEHAVSQAHDLQGGRTHATGYAEGVTSPIVIEDC